MHRLVLIIYYKNFDDSRMIIAGLDEDIAELINTVDLPYKVIELKDCTAEETEGKLKKNQESQTTLPF